MFTLPASPVTERVRVRSELSITRALKMSTSWRTSVRSAPGRTSSLIKTISRSAGSAAEVAAEKQIIWVGDEQEGEGMMVWRLLDIGKGVGLSSEACHTVSE